MFYGEYRHSLDQKGRLILPARFRDICRDSGIEKFFLTRGLDKCIFMFSEEEWKIQEKKFKNMPFTKQESRHFNRLFFSGAADVIPDKQGRFIIPPYLKTYARIQKDTLLVGVSNRIEIWDADTWASFYDNNSESFERIAENMMESD
ncbi:MAG TPA: division/cell wall cluster transcriptional repressor MraZ [Candidatus Omnitrophota bacterium]|nr:division/cell wall cluster transcriptional repressor MraZ [Candidatus Omnitrophota bacterium]HPB67669.1 division/cell wall cluster transcriptional repressor MraZ [Candidatus Omnitrophota bacterium]HQO57950.1 division/cell wall cluster transcriptional repressor MraZ [Candidatus Omnitrophota bacterium]